ncbi:hypothetical protein BM607_000960 [Shewanella sp. SACH]|uniref:DUF6622 family protein n=1 Tax=Shewanella sp. SACH TaxID=1873135 RepID=UPI000903D956|nr:DUF6622 family protein [Shewanella sp. SACH]OUS52541.1 hypothetical protein BM607_000960 [Shewanella sp. SACH]
MQNLTNAIGTIVSHTPMWVFALLAGVIYLGLSQTKDRQLSLGRVLLMPAVMSIWSVMSLNSSLHSPLALMLWGVSLLLTVGVAWSLLPKTPVSYQAGLYHIKGSWLPLLLILGIFIIKYAVAYTLATQANILENHLFIAITSATYGLLSGIFILRAVRILTGAHHAQINGYSAH